METGGTLPWKMVLEIKIDLRKAFDWLKFRKTRAAADGAVNMYDTTLRVQFDPENNGQHVKRKP